MDHSPLVVFVLGGPGSGKGTLCKQLELDYNVKHLSVGDVLRAEANRKQSEYRDIIRQNMEQGKVGPKEITVALLERAIGEADKLTKPVFFLIDGFPRQMDQALHFKSLISTPTLVLCLACPPDVLRERLLRRQDGRKDDVIEIIDKRIKTFQTVTTPVLERYRGQNLLIDVDATREVRKVYDDVVEVLGTRVGKAFEDSRR